MPSFSGVTTKAAAAAFEALHTGNVYLAARALSNKVTRKDIIECINSLTNKQVEEIATKMHEKVKYSLGVLAGHEIGKLEAPQSATGAATYLKSSTVILKVILESFKEDVPLAVASVIFELHDSLLCISEPLAVQDAIAKLLIDYWNLDAPRAMEVVVQLGPFLLWRAIGGKPADVKRLHAVREAFYNLDLAQPESQDTVDMILTACITPGFLRCAEGKRVLAFFFELDRSLANRLLRTMTGQIGVGKPFIMDAYGEILFKAWQLRRAQSADHIEGCIQQLMQNAIMAQSTQMSVNMRKVLSYLHEQRRFHDVGTMLHRLYEPILWCHLKAAHFQVRMNALGILLEAFPIQDSTGNVEIEEGMNMQLSHVMKALRDPNAEVRAAAAWGACELLTTWWELLPGQAISRIMVLLQDTVFDGDSPKVRMAVLEGLTVLVENPLAQHSMALLLPKLRPVLFDPNVNVRVRMASLMMRVSQINAMMWWTIVPVPELLYVMGNDCDAVAKIIQAMLFSQYVDCDSSESIQECTRLLQLLRDNPSAGVAFCKFLAQQSVSSRVDGISPQLLWTWSHVLSQHLLHCDIRHSRHTQPGPQVHGAVEDKHPKKRGRVKRTCEDVPGGNSATEEVESPEQWTGLVAGLRELIVPLYEHLEKAKSSKSKTHGHSKHVKSKSKEKFMLAADTQPPLEFLSDDELTLLLELAPTLQAAQIVLSIAFETPNAKASKAVCQLCLQSFKGGYLYLNGMSQPGQRSVRILVHTIPHQGRLSASHMESCAVMCQAVDLALRCNPQQFLSVVGDALTATEGQHALDGKRRRRANKCTTGGSGSSSLCANGALVLTAMAARDVSSQRMVASSPNYEDFWGHLSEVMSQYIVKLGHSGSIENETHGFLHDALLAARSLYMLSAIACEARAHCGENPFFVIKYHADRVRAAVTDYVQGIVQHVIPIQEVVQICSTLIANRQGISDDDCARERSNKLARKRGKVSSLDASVSHPHAALLRIVCDATYDLAVAANAAVDVVDDLTVIDGCTNHDDAVHASADAAKACKDVWQSLKQLLYLYVQLFTLRSGPVTGVQPLLQVAKDVALCSVLSVQAIFRGMGTFHVPGDVVSLFSELGTSLALLHATCGGQREDFASKNVLVHVEDLAAAVLTACVYIEPERDTAVDGSAIQTPVRSHAEAEEAMGMLIKASVLLVADQLDVDDSAGHNEFNSIFPVLWISNATKKLDLHVATAVKFNIAKQLQRWAHDTAHHGATSDDAHELLRCGSHAVMPYFIEHLDEQPEV